MSWRAVDVIMSVALAFGIALAAGAQTHADSASRDQMRDIREFAPVYERYVHAVQDRGIAGLKEVALPDLVMSWPGERHSGARAFRALSEIYSDLKDTRVADKVWRLRVTGSTATAMVEETITWPIDQGVSAWMTWDWRHTWHKTPDGWKLARIERTDIGPDKARPAVSFTVTAGETK